jgi:hypothetical protein
LYVSLIAKGGKLVIAGLGSLNQTSLAVLVHLRLLGIGGLRLFNCIKHRYVAHRRRFLHFKRLANAGQGRFGYSHFALGHLVITIV